MTSSITMRSTLLYSYIKSSLVKLAPKCFLCIGFKQGTFRGTPDGKIKLFVNTAPVFFIGLVFIFYMQFGFYNYVSLCMTMFIMSFATLNFTWFPHVFFKTLLLKSLTIKKHSMSTLNYYDVLNQVHFLTLKHICPLVCPFILWWQTKLNVRLWYFASCCKLSPKTFLVGSRISK